MKDAWVIIPAFNEEKNIDRVLIRLRRFLDSGVVGRVVVVDDGSSDHTAELAERHGVSVLRHVVNLGKGAALKTGCEYAYRKGAGYFILMDADGQHNPGKIPLFLEKLRDSDVVLGYRRFNKKMPLVLKLGNWVITQLTKALYKVEVYDPLCGFRAFSRKSYKKLIWRSTGYSVEAEMVANAGSGKLKYAQIPIKTIYTDKYKGTTFLDGMRIAVDLLLWRLRGG